jgi:hypothetical protein
MPETKPISYSNRAHRLPQQWSLPPDWARWATEWCREHEIDVSYRQILDWADLFKDYWCSVPGAKGTKLDWQATWRNWARREAGSLARRQRATQPTAPDESPQADRSRRRSEQAAALRQQRRELVDRFVAMNASEQTVHYTALSQAQKMAVRHVLKPEAWKQISQGIRDALRAGLSREWVETHNQTHDS